MEISIAALKFKQGGGFERYLLDLIRGFHQNQITPKVYSASFDTDLPEYHWIQARKLPLSFIPKKLRTFFFSQAIKKHKAPNEILLTITQIQGADINICGGQHKGYLNALNKKASLFDKYKIFLEQKSYQESKLIIAHSQLMKKELMQYYQVPENKIAVIYPPVDTQKFMPSNHLDRLKLREKFGFSQEEIIYLFPSTGHSRKGFSILKDYFEQTTLPIKLVVAGTPVNESKNIRSLGFCQNMQELYKAADFTIMASKYEPFGLVGIESILCGTPIIFSENMGCTEVLQHNFGYLFKLNNKNSLNDVILSSVKHQERITEPFSVLKYNPELQEHINSLNNIISQLN